MLVKSEDRQVPDWARLASPSLEWAAANRSVSEFVVLGEDTQRPVLQSPIPSLASRYD